MELAYLCIMLYRRPAIIIFLIVLSLGAMSQYFYGGLAYTLPRTNFVVDSTGNIRFQPGDLGFVMQAGAIAASGFNNDVWFGTSVSPALAYNVSSRFRVKAGVSIMQGFGDSYSAGFDRYYYPYSTSGTTTSIFVQGDYILNNKLMVSGAVYKYFSPNNIQMDDPRFRGPEGEGVMFNINYRPARNFEINASFEYGSGTGSYHQNPFYRPSPFRGDPMFGW